MELLPWIMGGGVKRMEFSGVDNGDVASVLILRRRVDDFSEGL